MSEASTRILKCAETYVNCHENMARLAAQDFQSCIVYIHRLTS
jgi:hypothetical protein